MLNFGAQLLSDQLKGSTARVKSMAITTSYRNMRG